MKNAKTGPDSQRTPHPELTSEMEQCAIDCLNCHSVCLRVISYCLRKGGNHAQAHHISLMMNCAEICQTTENFILSADPDLSTQLTDICSDICERCARSCEQFSGDALMVSCAEICRTCAISCRNIARPLAA